MYPNSLSQHEAVVFLAFNVRVYFIFGQVWFFWRAFLLRLAIDRHLVDDKTEQEIEDGDGREK